MKILYLGIFDDHELGGDIVLRKGFLQNNCEVESLDYRKLFSINNIDVAISKILLIARGKDLVFVGKGELITPILLKKLKKIGISTALWYGDIRIKIEPWSENLLPMYDYFFCTVGGDYLKYYHSYRTHKISAYFFNPVDDELPEKYGHDFCKKTRDIVFTGSAYNFAGIERKDVIRYLLTRNDVNFFGGIENIVNANNIFHKIKRKFLSQGNRYNKRISGEEYVAVIKSAKIGIGVNAIQTVPRYTSDRLQHFMSFGTFFLQFYFPELEKFFNLKEEIVSFKSIYELEKYIDYYLKNPEQREKIARAGQCKILSCYNTKNITKMMLDIINTGNSTMFEWTDILS